MLRSRRARLLVRRGGAGAARRGRRSAGATRSGAATATLHASPADRGLALGDASCPAIRRKACSALDTPLRVPRGAAGVRRRRGSGTRLRQRALRGAHARRARGGAHRRSPAAATRRRVGGRQPARHPRVRRRDAAAARSRRRPSTRASPTSRRRSGSTRRTTTRRSTSSSCCAPLRAKGTRTGSNNSAGGPARANSGAGGGIPGAGLLMLASLCAPDAVGGAARADGGSLPLAALALAARRERRARARSGCAAPPAQPALRASLRSPHVPALLGLAAAQPALRSTAVGRGAHRRARRSSCSTSRARCWRRTPPGAPTRLRAGADRRRRAPAAPGRDPAGVAVLTDHVLPDLFPTGDARRVRADGAAGGAGRATRRRRRTPSPPPTSARSARSATQSFFSPGVRHRVAIVLHRRRVAAVRRPGHRAGTRRRAGRDADRDPDRVRTRTRCSTRTGSRRPRISPGSGRRGDRSRRSRRRRTAGRFGEGAGRRRRRRGAGRARQRADARRGRRR